jgi:holo-[acyl-carrier protein] synthase
LPRFAATAVNILGIGIDIVEIARIESLLERQGERFLERVFSGTEREYCGAMREPARCYAARFAAKEAVSKAFGTGIGANAEWLDLVIERHETGRPSVRLEGAAAAFASHAGIREVLITLSHSEHYAVAQAVAVGG